MGKFILKHWMELTAGTTLTVIIALAMKGARGYFAVGGEWLLAPLFILLAHLFREELAHDLPWLMEIMKDEDDELKEEE